MFGHKHWMRVGCALAFIFVLTAPMLGAHCYVKADATGTPVDGSSWDRAFRTIAQGVASSGEVWVAAGTYTERISLLAGGVALYGGFAGTETALEQRNPAANLTIIDGSAGGSVIYGKDLKYGMTIDGFTLRNGSSGYGGGVWLAYCAQSRIANCLIISNTAATAGGGVYVDSTDVVLVNNRIVGNTSNFEGGGFTSYFGTHLIANNVIAHNKAGFVGAVGTRYGTLTVTNNTLVDNSGRGTVDMMSGTVTLANNIIAGGTYGVSNETATVTMRNNCFFGNLVDYCNSVGNPLPTPIGSDGNIQVDPSVINTSGAELLLSPDSPCVNAGNNTDVVSAYPDIQGQPRIQNGTVDIGADEADGTTAAWKVAYVDAAAVDDNGAGTSWATARKSLNAGMALVSATGGEVWVKAGAYTATLNLVKGVQIYGGFAGTETSRNQRSILANPCILDGGQSATVVKGDSPVGWFTVLDGFTIRNGKADKGGGVSCIGGGPQIRNCLITGNTANQEGGGVYSNGGWPTLIGNTIVNNTSSSHGAGVRYYSGIGKILNNRITGNVSGQAGGGIVWDYTNLFIANNVIAHNHGGWVGGVGGWGGSATIINNTITDNMGRGSIDLMGASAIIANNIITGGTYAIVDTNGAAAIRNNCFYDNYKIYTRDNGSEYANPVGANGNISAEPGLVNDAAGALKLPPGSPCIDAGSTGDAFTLFGDIDGAARVGSGTVDIGADEADGSTPIWGVYYVNGATGDDAKNGLSWANAKKSPQAGMDLASKLGGEVWVTAGVYTGPVTLKSGVRVYGGFTGTETARDQRNFNLNETTIDAAQADRVVIIPWYVGRFTWLDGFTIRNGLKDKGAGIYSEGSPLIRHCVLHSNTATNEGGAAYITGGWPIVRDCLIYNNSSTYHGAALRVYDANLTAIGNRIVENAAGQAGGAIVWNYGNQIIANNVVAFNHGGWVGGVGGWGGTSVIVNNTIVDNQGRGSIDLMGGTSTVANNIIAGGSNGIFIDAGSTTASYRNNCFYRNYEDFVNLPNQLGSNGNFSADPKVVTSAKGYLLLDPTSTCIGAGSNEDILTAYGDVEGESRLQGARVDVGADESIGSTPAWTVMYVNGASGADSNSGTSWAAAKKTVQAGLDAASLLGGQLWVTGGVYKEKITVRKGVHAYGGFAGTETQLFERLPANPATVLDGEQTGTVVTAPWTAGPYAVLDTFTITNGKASNGGGVVCAGGLTLRNSILSANQATGEGGAVYTTGWPTIQGCTISGNTSASHGAAVRSPSATKTWLYGNRITGNSSGQAGGALVWNGGTHVVANNLIAHNRAGWVGGVGGWSGFATITNNTFVDNSSRGQIDLMGASAVITNNIIVNGLSVGVFGDGNSATTYNNDVFGNVTNYSGVADPGTARGNMAVDPQFTDAAHDNFTLQAGSACRDTGLDTAVQVSWVDAAGLPRIQGTHVDIGAYEYTGATGYRWWDVTHALRLWAGLTLASGTDASYLNVAPDTGITLLDVVKLARKAAGRDPNP